LEYLGRYGIHAKEVLPQLQEIRRNLVKTERGKEQSDRVKLIDASIAAIEASKVSPTMLHLKEFMAHPSSVREKTQR
jgi:predicted transcriptional regulator